MLGKLLGAAVFKKINPGCAATCTIHEAWMCLPTFLCPHSERCNIPPTSMYFKSSLYFYFNRNKIYILWDFGLFHFFQDLSLACNYFAAMLLAFTCLTPMECVSVCLCLSWAPTNTSLIKYPKLNPKEPRWLFLYVTFNVQNSMGSDFLFSESLFSYQSWWRRISAWTRLPLTADKDQQQEWGELGSEL